MATVFTTEANAPQRALSTENRLHASLTRVFADMMRALTACSDDVQAAVLEMIEIVNDPESDADDRDMALATIQEALFPRLDEDGLHIDGQGAGTADESTSEATSLLAELDAEEAAFATRVQRLMDAREMTQGELAAAAGVGQSAISMMLARNCRPQGRTVSRIAAALGVKPSELWPD